MESRSVFDVAHIDTKNDGSRLEENLSTSGFNGGRTSAGDAFSSRPIIFGYFWYLAVKFLGGMFEG